MPFVLFLLFASLGGTKQVFLLAQQILYCLSHLPNPCMIFLVPFNSRVPLFPFSWLPTLIFTYYICFFHKWLFKSLSAIPVIFDILKLMAHVLLLLRLSSNFYVCAEHCGWCFAEILESTIWGFIPTGCWVPRHHFYPSRFDLTVLCSRLISALFSAGARHKNSSCVLLLLPCLISTFFPLCFHFRICSLKLFPQTRPQPCRKTLPLLRRRPGGRNLHQVSPWWLQKRLNGFIPLEKKTCKRSSHLS